MAHTASRMNPPAEALAPHRHEYEWSRYCGAQVCTGACRDHKGLARCYCGWPAGERLEDDTGNATFDGETWSDDD